MLEKYRKLANDAHLNGDRVNAEYYLQFADHYFRVIADTRVRQEEQRLRRDDRWQEGGEGASDEGDDSGEFGVESEFPAFDQPPVYTRREREDRPERTSERPVERTPDRSGDRPQSPSDYRRQDERPVRDGQDVRQNQSPAVADEQAPVGEPVGTTAESGDAVTAYEPPENPFLRENRGGRGLRPRREDRRPRREETAAPDETRETAGPETARPETARPETDRTVRAISAGIDPDSLPPSFTVSRDEPEVAPEAAVAPAPRRRARRKPAADDAGETIQSLS